MAGEPTIAYIVMLDHANLLSDVLSVSLDYDLALDSFMREGEKRNYIYRLTGIRRSFTSPDGKGVITIIERKITQ
jgi:hypothetical protein